MLPLLLFLLSAVVKADNSTNGTADGDGEPKTLGALFSDLTTLDLGLFILICLIVGAILVYLAIQKARSRARLEQVRRSEDDYALAQLHKQSLPPVNQVERGNFEPVV